MVTQLSTAFSSYTPPAEEDEPPTKKYKQLFDETDPSKIAQIGLDEYKNMFKNTQSQVPEYSEVSQRSSARRQPLTVVPEEDEENKLTPQELKARRRFKMGTSTVLDNIQELQSQEEARPTTPPPAV